jgi:glycosyltransferase involved in cell wall biosynthesis
MRIGFDAKRAFFNYSGLGNYSRNIILYLQKFYPGHSYHLYVPRRRQGIEERLSENQQVHFPESWMGKKLSSFWRSYWLPGRLEKDGIDLYHGLSNEIPFGIHKKNIKTVVTIHDLIFLRYPHWYNPIDRRIYLRKSRYSCRVAGRIIAISEQTRRDIVEFYGIHPDRIDVVYQGCDPAYYEEVSEEQRKEIRLKYGLPSDYLLNVGTIEKRKNLMVLVQALHSRSIDMPLVVVGRPTSYADEAKDYIREHRMEHIFFLEHVPNEDLPALYQSSSLFIYPSQFEGFGIPVMEALNSGTPVITSKGGCFAEAGGEHSLYVEPGNADELGVAILKVLNDSDLRKTMIYKGQEHALKFREEIIAKNIFEVYEKILA